MNEDDWGRGYPCPCYAKIMDCPASFKKVLELKNGGLVIYCYLLLEKAYHKTDIAKKKMEADEHVFIIHNTKDAAITSADLLPEIENNAISCPRCRHLMDHALNTLQTVSSIRKNTAIAICDHCKLKLQPCFKCEAAIKKFFELKKEGNENKFSNNEVGKWLSQFRDEFKSCFPDETIFRSEQFKDRIVNSDNILPKAQSDDRIDQLCRWELASGKQTPLREMYPKAEKKIISLPSVTETGNVIKNINFRFADKINKVESSRYRIGRKAKSADVNKIPIWDEGHMYQPIMGKSGLDKINDKEIPKSVDQINLSKPGASTRRKGHYQDDVLSNEDIQQYAHSKDKLPIKKETEELKQKDIHETSQFEALEKGFRFSFPRTLIQIVEKNIRQKSSSDLIHDIRERVRLRIEDIERKREELHLKKIEEAKKKQVAQKENRMKAEENKELYAETIEYTASALKMIDLSKPKEKEPETKHTSKRGQLLKMPVSTESSLKSVLDKTKDQRKDRSKQHKTEDKKLENQHTTKPTRQIVERDPKYESKSKTRGQQPKPDFKSTNVKTNDDSKQPLPEIVSKLIKADSNTGKAADKQLSTESKTLKAKSKTGEKMPKAEPTSSKAESEGKSKAKEEIPKVEKKPLKEESPIVELKKNETEKTANLMQHKTISKTKFNTVEKVNKVESLNSNAFKELKHEIKDFNAKLKPPTTESRQPFELKPTTKEHKAGSHDPNNKVTHRKTVSKEDKEDRTLKLYTKENKSSDIKVATFIEKEKGTDAGAKADIDLLNPKNDIENSDKTKKFSLIEEKPLKIEEDIMKYRKEIKLRDQNESRVPRRQLEKLQTPVVLPTPKHENTKKEHEANSIKILEVNGVENEQKEALLKMMTASQILIHLNKHKHIKKESCPMCVFSVLELEFESKNRTVERIHDIIKGRHVRKAGGYIENEHEEFLIKPLLFQIHYDDKFRAKTIKAADYCPATIRHFPSVENVKTVKNIEPVKGTKGVIHYALSDRSFIEKGWTKLPSEKVVRKMNVYRMRPSHPEFDWFKRNKNKQLLTYDTGERLAEFDEDGRGRWFYKNQRLALQYYDAEEVNAQQRFIIFSNGEPDDRGRSRPYTILATFDYLGNGIVFDHGGKIRLKYNQTEGVVLDRGIGPASHWKWHTLNDPPVLQQVMIDTQMTQKDPDIFRMGGKDQKARPDDEDRLAIEFDNFVKEKSKKITENYKPFQIKMKALKINENFSLKILDQANVYLIFREGATNIKLNLGMLLDHKEIVDTDTAEVDEVTNNIERFPARTDSLAAMQKSVAYARLFERTRTERERRLAPAEPSASVDILTTGVSRPLRLPLHVAFSSCTTKTSPLKPRGWNPVSNFSYYNNRLC